MPSNSEKGRRIEVIAAKHLEATGHQVDRTVRHVSETRTGYISQGNDFWGCFDLMAKRQGERIRFIQVTMDSSIGRRIEKIRRVPWSVATESIELWKWQERPRGGDSRFQVYSLDDDFRNTKSRFEYPR